MSIQLKVGDKIYINEYGALRDFEIIEKVTKTTAKSKRRVFEKEASENGYVGVKGQGKWASKTGWLASAKLDQEWEDVQIQKWYYRNKDTFTLEQIKQIKNILYPPPNTKL